MKDKIDYCKMLFGSSLFADHLKQDEEDTLWENKTFTNLKKYLEDNHSPAYAAARGTSQEVLDAELKKSLDTLWDCADCAKLYRNKLIPSTGEWMYRGMGLPLDLFKKMAKRFPDSKKKDGIVIASVPYQYKRVVESWSTDFITSMRFTWGPRNYATWRSYSRDRIAKEWEKIADEMATGKETAPYIPVVWMMKTKSRKCLFNPDFTDLLSSWQQREILRFDNSPATARVMTHHKFVDLVLDKKI